MDIHENAFYTVIFLIWIIIGSFLFISIIEASSYDMAKKHKKFLIIIPFGPLIWLIYTIKFICDLKISYKINKWLEKQ